MLEIAILYVLAKNIGNKVAAKGRKRLGYQLLLIALWLGGEFAGGVVGAIAHIILAGGKAAVGQRGIPWMAYLFALAGAALGAGIAFAVASMVTPVQDDADLYEIDESGRDEVIRRKWSEVNDRPVSGGDQIQERPASRQDDRIRE